MFLVWAQEFTSVELVHKKPFIPLSACVLERSEPQVASNRRQLLGQRDDLQVHHQLVDQVRISLCVIDELEDRLRVLIDSRQQLIIKITTLALQLRACQVTQVIIGLTDQFLGVQERID